jgi:hypothetical protein
MESHFVFFKDHSVTRLACIKKLANQKFIIKKPALVMKQETGENVGTNLLKNSISLQHLNIYWNCYIPANGSKSV